MNSKGISTYLKGHLPIYPLDLKVLGPADYFKLKENRGGYQHVNFRSVGRRRRDKFCIMASICYLDSDDKENRRTLDIYQSLFTKTIGNSFIACLKI